ncbi:MAG: FMN-binding protein [Desulfosudaceae bacterium]
MAKEKGNNFFKQAWLVLVLAMFYGAALAGVHLNFSPIIEENKINETRQQIPELIFGPAGDKQDSASRESLQSERLRITVGGNGRQKAYRVFQATRDNKVLGWVAKATGQGYADEIQLLIGLSPRAGKITGLFVLDQKETPGLGAKIVEPDWRAQFAGQTTDSKLKVVKDGADERHEVDAITGATVSSQVVCNIVNKTVADLKPELTEQAGQGDKTE